MIDSRSVKAVLKVTDPPMALRVLWGGKKVCLKNWSPSHSKNMREADM